MIRADASITLIEPAEAYVTPASCAATQPLDENRLMDEDDDATSDTCSLTAHVSMSPIMRSRMGVAIV
jgi:hypothetical protein